MQTFIRPNRNCPVCASGLDKSVLFLEESIDQSKLSGFSFASRKLPEYMNHRLVRCKACDLVYVSNPPGQDELAVAYHQADYDSSQVADDAAISYIRALEPVFSRLKYKTTALEIGAGTGVLLDHLQSKGFSDLIGVEPSTAAIEAAPAHRKKWLKEGIFHENEFKPNSIDLICCFMTMEHVQDPSQTASAAFNLLRPGGAFVTITHDYHSVVNRLLGKRSPIIDIEHMQLFSNQSIQALFKRTNYVDITAQSFVNRYALSYWLRLAPLPVSLKPKIEASMRMIGLDKLKMSIAVGNTLAVGYKPSN
jgi:2-polyprenyl-3-methyl-5-hydroxy-6-metoxy-1,4-benzoquinol methylase